MRRLLFVAAALFFPALFTTAPLCADQATPSAISQPKPISLNQALAGAETPKEEIYIAVGADGIDLPAGAAAPSAGDTVTNTAFAYGRIVVPFDDIEAIAAPTRVVLNTEPPAPNPYNGMPPEDAFKLLLGSLNHAQWTKLIGKIGISYQDLTTDDQRALFGAMFPVTPLKLGPHSLSAAGVTPPTIGVDMLKTAHMRLGKEYTMSVPVAGTPMSLGGSINSDDPTPRYFIDRNSQNQDHVYGAALRAIVPNTLKDSDLDYGANDLHSWVNLNGVKTVGDLVARIGLATHLEIYADPHYESRFVQLLGSAPARADNLLQALALCVAGTYRRVGTAYVLTDDLTGVGVRRSIIDTFTDEADEARKAAETDAGESFYTKHHGMDDLSFIIGPTDLSPAEMALFAKQKPNPYSIPGEAAGIQVKFADLTATQSDNATKFKEGMDAGQAGLAQSQRQVLTLDQTIGIGPGVAVELYVPGLDGVIDLDFDLSPSPSLRQHYVQKQQAETVVADSPAPEPPAVTKQSIDLQLQPIGSRALIASPRTPADVDSIIAAMKVLGLNQLWLNVFSDGVSHLSHAPKSKGTDLLTEALTKTVGTGIAVIPTIDLLKWSPDAPADIQDLTMLGENSAQAITNDNLYSYRMQQMTRVTGDPAVELKSTVTYVCPADPYVRDTLVALVKRIASTQGIAGIALRETLANGYDQEIKSFHFSTGRYTLGYTVPMRLAFLRAAHEDPLDLDHESPSGEALIDTSLPDYDDSTITADITNQWDRFRSDTNDDLLKLIWLTAQTAAKSRHLPIWVHNRGETYSATWFGLWAGPSRPLPKLTGDFVGVGGADMAAVAGSTSRTNMLEVDRSSVYSLDQLSGNLNEVKAGWAGFVIDASNAGNGGDPIANLVSAVSPAKETAMATGKQTP